MDATAVRRVFPSWSISVPRSFAETFEAEDGYWHAYDAHRSVSLTSVLVSDDRGPVPARTILERFESVLEGTEIPELPPGTSGWAVATEAIKPARASRMLAGLLVADGRMLVVTITSDDLAWARGIWSSIRSHATASAEPVSVSPIRRPD
jgi:hypothetical protein